MKITPISLALCSLLLTGAAHAATPPGHPAPAVVDAALPNTGKVISTINASQYTYIEVAQGKQVLWLAAPAIAVKKNNTIRFEDGAEMTNFHSKSLNRTFPNIRFINRVVVTADKN